MSKPTIHGKRRRYSASDFIDAAAADLLAIKIEDQLTFGDLGRILGKSEDQAAKYCDGTAEMPLSTFCFAWEAWNGRFLGSLRRMLEESAVAESCAHKAQSRVLEAALALSVALEDGELDEKEIHANRGTLENARDAIDAQLAKLKPKPALNQGERDASRR